MISDVKRIALSQNKAKMFQRGRNIEKTIKLMNDAKTVE